MNEHRLGDTLYFEAQTFDSGGAAVDADSTPTYTVWRNNSAVGSMTNQNLTNSETGVYRGSAAITSGNGFADGDNISVRATATVDGVVSKAVLCVFQVVAARAEDALRPTTAGRTLDVGASGDVTVGAIAADSITSTALAGSAVTEIQAGLSTLTEANIRDAVGLGTANLDSQLGAIQASANTIDTNVQTVVSTTNTIDGKVDIIDNFVDTEVAAIKADTTAILADTGTDGVVVATGSKSGYALASTGLDAVAVTAPTGVATTFPGMVVQLFRRFFGKVIYSKVGETIKTYADDGTTVVTTQTAVNSAANQSQGAAS